MVKRLVFSVALAACVASPALSFASELPTDGLRTDNIVTDPSVVQPTVVQTEDVKPLSIAASSIQPAPAAVDNTKSSSTAASSDKDASRVLTLSGGGSKLHGFGFLAIDTQYITPRGLVALESSPQFQVLIGLAYSVYSGEGLIEDVSINGGIWSDLNPHPDVDVVTGADTVAEIDFWIGFDVKFAKNWKFSYSLEAWTFPDWTGDNKSEIDPTTEYNMEFKFSYDDTDILKDFALHPYVNVFWNFSGSCSPVVAQALLGKNDNTMYAELGVCPSYTFKGIPDCPLTFTFPTYVTFGDSSFWGETPGGSRSNWGVLSTGMKISAPLNFIPKDFGSWNAYIGFQYYNTLNPGLTFINSATGADSNLVLGYAGLGFGF